MSSKEVDERVVEMRFDNAQFEKNVQTSMSTLDKLKAKLNFNGVSKGLEDVGNAAKKLEFSGVTSGIETVQAKLSAMEVIGVTALANITNSAVNAGKRIASAITIDPVRDGFNEYETQMNAVQTILANTQKEGTNVKQVNAALDQLNTYADKTIYNFTEMTRNIGTFTAAGVKLDTSVSAIQGIANLAAVSGSTSQQASTAMYQLSQALASGTVKLMDWNSVVNAGMGGQVFQDALIRTSEKLGTGAQAYIDAAGSFRESLSKGWLTTDVLTETLDMFSTAADTEEEYAAAIQKFVDEGYSEEQAVDMANMAKTAGEAATKVKTFTQLIDTLKEALGSGWTTTWRLIIGDFEEAKELWTNVSDVLSKLINNASEARNKLVEGVMSFNPFTNMLNKLENSDVGKTVKQINNLTNSLEYYQKVVTDVWRGDYKNSDTGRYELLDETGYNHQVIQDLVNKGYEYELTVEDVQEAEAKFADSLGDSTEKIQNESKQLSKLSDEQLRHAGLTDDEISMYRDLEKQSEKTGKSIEELINDMSAKDGRTLLWDGLGNIGETLIITFTAIKDAFSEIFPAPSVAKIYGVIDGFNALTEKMKEFSSTHAYDVEQTFKGLFAVIDIVRMVLSSGLTVAFKALKGILSAFDIDIIEFTGYIGEALVNLRNWLKNNDYIEKSFKKVGEGLKVVIDGFKKLIDLLKESPRIQKFVDIIKDIDLKEAGGFVVEGLKKGLSSGLSIIPDMLKDIGLKLLSAFEKVLRIASPSKEMEADGEFVVAGLVKGIENTASTVWDAIKDIGTKIITKFKEIKVGEALTKVISVGAGVGMLAITKNLVDTFKNITAPMASVGEFIETLDKSVKKTAKAIGKNLKASAFEKKTEGVRNLALALLALSAAVFIMSKIDTKKLWSTVGAIGVLAVILVGLAVAISKLTDSAVELDGNSKTLKLSGLKTTLISIGVALALMAATVKIMGSLNPDAYMQGLLGLVALMGVMMLLIVSMSLLVSDNNSKSIQQAGKAMKKIATAMILMVAGIAILGNMKPEKYAQGLDGFNTITAALLATIIGLVALTYIATDKDISQVGNLMLKISASMLLMAVMLKMLKSIEPAEMIKGALIVGAAIGLVVVLVALSHLGKKNGKDISQVGNLMLKISASMLLMAVMLKMLKSVDYAEIGKGALILAGVAVLIAGLVALTHKASDKQIKGIGKMLLAVSLCFAVMAGVCLVLGLLPADKIVQGLAAVAAFTILIEGLIAVAAIAGKVDENASKTLMSAAIAIGVMAAAVAILSILKPEKIIVATACMSVLVRLFALVEFCASKVQGAMGSLIAMAVVIGLLGGLLIAISCLPVEKTMVATAELAILMAVMAGVMFLVSKVPVSAAITGAAGLAAFIGIFAATLAILGGLSKIPGVSDIVNSGGEFLANIGYALGNFIGSIIGGFGAGVSSGLPEIGTNLALFMENAQPFFDGITGIDAVSMIANIGSLTAAILLLTAADFISGMATFMKGKNSFSQLGKELSAFIVSAQPFIDGAKSLTGEMMEGVKALSETLLMLTAADLIDGISSWLTGGTSLSDFAEQLKPFGEAMVEFSDVVAGKIDIDAVNSAANAGKIMAEMEKSVTKTGGVVQWFTGEHDMGKFSTQLVQFGRAIVRFSDTVSVGVNEEAITAAANAGKIMAEMQKDITPSGGVVEWFTGEKDMGKFSTQLTQFGNAIVNFSSKVAGKIDEGAVTAAANAGAIIADMQKNIAPSGGVVQWFTGDKDMSAFSKQLVQFGEAIVKYSDKVTNVDATGVEKSLTFSRALLGVINSSLSINENGITKFGKTADIGTTIQAYAEKIASVNLTSVTTSISAAKQLRDFVQSLNNFDISGIVTFDEAVKEFSKVNMSSIKNVLDGYSSEFNDLGKKFLTSLVEGYSSKEESFLAAVDSSLQRAIETINSYYQSINSSGAYLVSGFVSGINVNTFRVEASARTMAKAAYDAAKRELDINSPSRVMEKLASYVPAGFAKGINNNLGLVNMSSSDMANTVIDGVGNAISKISELINGDMNMQPTIRPVVDLSDVQTGVGAIAAMMPIGGTIGISGGFNTVATMMNRNRQNGNNDEVISAINKLDKSLNGLSKPTYNVGGITYDDGSAVSDAVQELIRAARIDRRS
nr:MAG TPA: tail tape measure [Caudoviricetes sp.]